MMMRGVGAEKYTQQNTRWISQHAKTGFLSIFGSTFDAEIPVSCNVQCV
jgi:hypothetical protein